VFCLSGLGSRLGLQRVSFKPYDQEDIRKIVAARLGSLAAFDPDAIELCARKVASVSGDVRRALQICRRASEVAEERCNRESESCVGSPEPTRMGGTGPLVVMQDVLSAVKDMSNKSNQDNITELPLHGRLVLCILANQNQRTDEGVLEFAVLASRHRDLCRKLNLAKLTEDEHDVDQVEAQSETAVSAPVSPASDADTAEMQEDDVDEMLLKYINESATSVHTPSATNGNGATTNL
jgi:origin recognition complex subunit 1